MVLGSWWSERVDSEIYNLHCCTYTYRRPSLFHVHQPITPRRRYSNHQPRETNSAANAIADRIKARCAEVRLNFFSGYSFSPWGMLSIVDVGAKVLVEYMQ